jgi:hypothetical protein
VQKEPPHSRFVVLFEARGRSFPEPLGQKGRFLAAVVLEYLWAESGIPEDQGVAVSERDFLGLPIWALGEALGLCAGGTPFLVEPVQIRFVIGDPFLDGLQGGSMGSMVSMSKGGGGGRGRWMMPSQRPWRRRKN